MTTNWIFWSFLASILTNVILVSGVLALIYYVGEKKLAGCFAIMINFKSRFAGSSRFICF